MRSGALHRLAPLYLVVFIGFVGYSLMITIFTPLILRDDGGQGRARGADDGSGVD